MYGFQKFKYGTLIISADKWTSNNNGQYILP